MLIMPIRKELILNCTVDIMWLFLKVRANKDALIFE